MKTLKKLHYLIVCLSINISFAQLKDTFEKGSITKINNEKVDGFIKTEDLSKLASDVCFKLLERDKECVNYDTSQLKSFNTENGKYFDLMTIKINNGNKEITIFANLILKGTVSLYKVLYDYEEFFVISKNNVNYVLQDDKLVSGETEIRKYNYIGTLNTATDGFLMINYKNFEFNENNLTKIVSDYSASKGYEIKQLNYFEKNTHFIIASVGYGFKQDATEYFFQGIYRVYFPKISRSTSFNVGLNYFKYQNIEPFYGNTYKYTRTLTSVPIQFQQNLLSKNIRPYLFVGFDLNYLKIVDDSNNSLLVDGLQNNFGVGILYGAGIEIDVYKGIMLKSEYRKGVFSHLIQFGIGYNFSK
jgi:hypothetical protein